MPDLVPFPLLADPATYRACSLDLVRDDAARAYWIDLFETHFEILLASARTTGVTEDALDRARRAMAEELRCVREQPDAHGALDLLVLDARRRIALDAGGIHDEFRHLKQRENDAAIRALPAMLARLDGLHEEARLEHLARSSLAGNLFDMGAPDCAGEFLEEAPLFEDALERVGTRPWRFDDLDRAMAWMSERSGGERVVLFADNAGGDFVLGALPITRELVIGGAEVVIAANRLASLNDVTAEEVPTLLRTAAVIDDVFASPRITVVDSGSTAPLIDLGRVSRELAAASADADLLVVLGMGRGIESNWDARFTCACWRLAMLKDPHVAQTIGGRVGDAICRFDPAPVPAMG